MKVLLKKPIKIPGGREIPAGKTIDVTPDYAQHLKAEGIAHIVGEPVSVTYPVPWTYSEVRSETPAVEYEGDINAQLDDEIEGLIGAHEADLNRDNDKRKKKKPFNL